MFPLGALLFPTAFLPLHVFEPRYRVMTRECLAGDGEFGVVLIERGSEVGGGDVRFDVGTVARIVEAVELEDGRFALGAVGVRRIRVLRWLEDDPYPRAEVEDWDDPPPAPDLAERLAPVVTTLRRALALASELGEPAAGATVAFHDDPVVASYQASAVAPVSVIDRLRLLSAPSAEARVALLGELLDEEVDVLSRRLSGG
jgi:Lon protease-like protein